MVRVHIPIPIPVPVLTALLAAGLALAPPAAAADIWVDGVNGSNSNTGGQSDPFLTITKALSVASTGDVIKVLEGDYDVALGETFPLDVPHNVDIIGQETLQADWPRIGGDVADSSVLGLVLVDASSSDRNRIKIEKLSFLGEDTAGEDAPAALYVIVDGDNIAGVVFENNVCKRPEMNDGASNDKATISADAGWGDMNLTIRDCTLEASALGGIAVVAGFGTTSIRPADPSVTVTNTTITAEGDDDADYGFVFAAAGEKWVNGKVKFEDSTIDNTGANANHGIDDGFVLSLETSGNGSLLVPHGKLFVTGNTIEECLGDGITFAADLVGDDGGVHISCWDLYGNDVRGNGGAALRIDRGDDTGGYVNIETQGNFFVENEYGVQAEGSGIASNGALYLLNDTIAENADFGLRILDSLNNIASGLNNCIVWGNNGGGVQHGGDVTWDPVTSSLNLFEHNDYDGGTGLSCTADSGGNIDCDPEFVDPANGDYHLDADSPCIDAGDNTPVIPVSLAAEDIDGDDRTIDGDEAGGDEVDMGADEYVP